MSWRVVLNAALFQLTWFGCVLGGARGEWYWGAVGAVALAGYSHFHGSLKRDLLMVVSLVPIGICLGSLWATTGVLDFGSEAQPVAGVLLPPVWICLLWAGVGMTAMNSLSFFASRPWLGAILAGGAAVPSYLGGERLGAVTIPEPFGLGWIVLAWGVVFFLVFTRARGVLSQEGVLSQDGVLSSQGKGSQ